MRVTRALAAPLCMAVGAGLTACFTAPPKHPVSPAPAAADLPLPAPAPPDAVPRTEPRSRSGNPPFYDVLGKRYFVLSSGVGYVERGVASWYGPGFHKERTSGGEPYDMYGMTAAHRTLPLPAYVRVTNLQNGRSVVVRVNDRGPFVGNRIIDLSYSAAVKLDMVRNGTAFVEVRSVDQPPGTLSAANTPAPTIALGAAAATPPVTPSATAAAPDTAVGGAPEGADKAPLFIQAGAFSDPANAQRLAAKLETRHYGSIFVRDDEIAGRRLYRVRIGPVHSVAEFDRVIAALERDGVRDAHLALE